MRFLDTDDSHIDVFLDELRLCHAVKWGRSPGEGSTLPLPELLLTKTQVVELEPKDIGDLSALCSPTGGRSSGQRGIAWPTWSATTGASGGRAAEPSSASSRFRMRWSRLERRPCSNTGTASGSDPLRDFVPPSETACAGTTNPRRSDMAMPGTRDVIDGIFADAATGDLEAVLRWWHDDGTLEDVTLAQAFVGKPALREYLDMYYRALPEVRVRADPADGLRRDRDGRVDADGARLRRFDGVEADGREVVLHAMDVFHVVDGLIVHEVSWYGDGWLRQRLEGVAGLPPALDLTPPLAADGTRFGADGTEWRA